MVRRVLVVAAAVVGVSVMGALTSAAAAEPIDVTTGQRVRLMNATECTPNREASLELVVQGSAAAAPVPLGTVLTDATGHFETEVGQLPVPAPGLYSILVSCGAEEGDLVFDIRLLVATSPMWQDLRLYGAAAGLVVLILTFVAIRRRRACARLAAELAAAAEPSAPPQGPRSSSAPLDESDDDGAEYWVWEVETDGGPRKRLACLTEKAFHLHELGEDDFADLLMTVREVGPDVAFSKVFLRMPVGEINEVARRGSLLRVATRAGSAQVIDLGTASLDVFSMLRRRLGDSVCREISVPGPATASSPTAASNGLAASTDVALDHTNGCPVGPGSGGLLEASPVPAAVAPAPAAAPARGEDLVSTHP